MASKTLLHVINSLGRGGAEVLLANTIKLLPNYRHVLVTLAPDGDLLEEIQPHLDAYYCLNALAVRAWPKGVYKLRNIIRKHNPILVHVHLQIAGILTKVACPKHIPLFYSLHNPYSVDAFHANRLALPLEKITARPYHHLIGVSRLVLDDYRYFVHNSGSSDVVYNMVGKQFFTAHSLIPYTAGKPLRCVSVGNLKHQKNYIHSLQSFAELTDSPISLDIYGVGSEEEMLKTFAEKHKLNKVRFMGKSNDIFNILPQYDLYLISSSYEGFGIAPLEAMAAGLPALVSDIPVFREVIGDAALYFDLSSPENLATSLRAIVAGELPITEIAQAGRQQAQKIAHPDNYIRSLLSVYQKY